MSNILTIIVNHIIALFSASCWKRISSDLIKECIETPYEWFLSKNSALVTRLFHSDLELWSRESINLILTIFSEFVILIFLSLMVVSVFPAEGIWAIILSFFLGLCLVYICRPKIRTYASMKRRSQDRTMLSTNQIFTGIKDVKISSKINFFQDFFNNSINEASYSLSG